ncbi:MAG: multicopper oxidase domain-containing protein [Syntrophothermus sp.]
MNQQRISRRDFLKFTGLGATALFASGLRRPSLIGEEFIPDAEVSITAKEKWVQILSGAQTRVWSYEGQLLSGSGVTVQKFSGTYLGPVLRAQSGKKVRIYFNNNLAEESVIHPHGLRVPQDCDGQPMQAIGPGLTKIYDFQVIDRAGPYWFHPHPMGRTAEQVAMGLAGLFTVWDPAEDLIVPGASTGANDIPVIIQDRNFDRNNQILYNPNMMWGYLGSRILVNGKANATFSLEPRAYRMRLLNGSNARTYKLTWSNGMPLKVIGTDGGLLPAVVSKNYVMLMPGERVDLWVDFTGLAGKQVILKSLTFDPGGMMGGGGGMGGGGMMGSSLANGAAFNILTVSVGRKASSKPVLGTLPALTQQFDAGNVANFNSPVPFVLAMQMGMTWTINGRVYEEMAVADDEMVYKDSPIAWEWINSSPIPHPMHIHNVMFRVVQRISPNTSSYSTVNQGFIDSGWKDTVIVWPGERVKIAMSFGPHTGMYMYHCHILEHEDMTMMRNLMIMDSPMPM